MLKTWICFSVEAVWRGGVFFQVGATQLEISFRFFLLMKILVSVLK